MPTKAELEAQLATALRLEAQNLQQQSLLLRAFGNASLFEGTPVEELAPLLRAAHGAGATAAAEAIAKAICSTNDRAENMWSTWALTLRYLPDGDLTRRCLFQILRRWILWENLIPKGELDFRTMYRVLEKLPRDHHTVSVTQTTELTVDNLNNLPAHGHWQRLEDVEWRIRVTNEANEQLCLGIEASVQTDNAFTFEGSFTLTKSAPRAQLLTILSRHDAESDDALDGLPWAAASLRGMDGCDEASAKECEDVLLRKIACEFSERSAALATLPAPLLGRLLRCDEIDTQTEEQTLLALAPWLEAPARTADEVAEALQGLRWAWLPARLVGRLMVQGGALAKFGEAEPVKDLVEKALSSKSAFKRARDDDSELNCPITHDLFEDPVIAADGHTYERAAIEQLITQGNRRSPMTNEQLAHTSLTANRALKKLVGAHRAMLEAAGSRKRLRFEASEPPADRLSDAMS